MTPGERSRRCADAAERLIARSEPMRPAGVERKFKLRRNRRFKRRKP
jgi:hypothetical protein